MNLVGLILCIASRSMPLYFSLLETELSSLSPNTPDHAVLYDNPFLPTELFQTAGSQFWKFKEYLLAILILSLLAVDLGYMDLHRWIVGSLNTVFFPQATLPFSPVRLSVVHFGAILDEFRAHILSFIKRIYSLHSPPQL